MIAVMLAGGYGKRLWPLTWSVPKALLPIARRPVLRYLLEKVNTIEKVTGTWVLTNKRFAHQFELWLVQYRQFVTKPVAVMVEDSCNEGNKPGAVTAIADIIRKTSPEEDLIVLATDIYFEDGLSDFIAEADKRGESFAIASALVKSPREASNFGALLADSDGKVYEFQEKASQPVSNRVFAGMQIIPRKYFHLVDEYLEKYPSRSDRLGDFIGWLPGRGNLWCYELKGQWRDIGSSPLAYREVSRLISASVRSR